MSTMQACSLPRRHREHGAIHTLDQCDVNDSLRYIVHFHSPPVNDVTFRD